MLSLSLGDEALPIVKGGTLNLSESSQNLFQHTIYMFQVTSAFIMLMPKY